MTKSYTLQAESGHVNFSSPAFRIWARHYYACFEQFRCKEFSPVPYFLLCRCIELAFKGLHLESFTQKDVKDRFGHNLVKSYRALPRERQTLTALEFVILEEANAIYSRKGFEYVSAATAAKGFASYPELGDLQQLSFKVVDQ